jgi:hypothetical protein
MSTRNPAPPDWFPLPIYSQMLTKDDWLTEIALRAGLQTADRNRRDGKPSRLTYDGSSIEVFRSLFVTRESRAKGNIAEARAGNFWPVREPTAFELFFLAENQRTPEQTEAVRWAERLNQDGKGNIAEFIASGAAQNVNAIERDVTKEPPSDIYLDVLGKRTPLLVDLDHDNETLELAFKVWLATARDALNEKAPRPVGDKEMTKWARFGLLPAFDLIFWSRCADCRFTDTYIATLIWPDTGGEFVDLTERFRKVTRPMVEEVFAWDFVQRFWRQMELEKSLELLVEHKNSEQH